MAQHEFDIIVYGATSFVGQILTRYMHTQFADGKLKWAIAGHYARWRQNQGPRYRRP